MPIRARVGRHTRSGGGHCQNWADDQKVIIDLLNSIPRTSGGTQGSLNPRIVAGICSNELYAAISAFESLVAWRRVGTAFVLWLRDHARRMNCARPSSRIRLSALTAIATSALRRSSARDLRASPMTRL